MANSLSLAPENPGVNHRRPLEDRDKDLRRNESFEYPKISSQNQIRLLAVDPPSSLISEQSKFKLQVEMVDKLPQIEYIALSYFWGEARTDNDIHHIIVEGQKFWVRHSLWTFFETVRKFDLTLPIYIDAICLDQTNVVERGHQVKLMEKVYRSAQQTHVWLGCPHERQVEVLASLQRLEHCIASQIPQQSWDHCSFIGLSYMCSRNYWRRLWVVQELLLSKAVKIHCGQFTFSWDTLLALTKTPLPINDTISVPEVDENLSWWDAWFFTQPEDYSQQLERDEQIIYGWQFALRLFRCRQRWPSRNAEGVLRTPDLPFHEAISAFQLQQCRVQRDKIFALIGLLDPEGRSMINPDYDVLLHQVFLDAAAAGLISLWKNERVSREDRIRLTNDNREFCERLHVLLGLENKPIKSRTTRTLMALHFANLHIHGRSKEASNAQVRQAGQYDAFRPDSEEHKSFSKCTLNELLSCGYPEFQEDSREAEFVSAARKNQSKVIRYLLHVGCDVNATHNGTTAIREALTCEHKDMAELLFENGARPDMDGGETILMTLLRLDRLEMFKLVLCHTRRPLRLEATHSGDTVFGKATDKRRFKMAELLGQHEADPDHPCGHATPLYRAAARGDKNMVRFLRRQNADLEKSCNGMSPLFIAARNNRYEVVRALVKLKADLESECGGATALYDAVRGNRMGMVKLLVELGANPYARVGGVPAVIMARNQGFSDVADFLDSQYSIWEFYAWLIARLYVFGGPLLAVAQWCKQGGQQRLKQDGRSSKLDKVSQNRGDEED